MKKVGVAGLIVRCSVFIIVVFIIGITGSDAFAQNNWTGHVNGFIGMKNLDDNDWEPLEEQFEFGLDIDFKQHDWPVNAVVGYWYSSDDDTVQGIDLDANSSELYAGVRKIFDLTGSQLQPFVGGGLAFVSAELEGALLGVKVSDDDTAFGGWIEGGAYLPVTENFHIGFDIRYSKAEVTLYGIDAEAGGLHYGVLAGYHW